MREKCSNNVNVCEAAYEESVAEWHNMAIFFKLIFLLFFYIDDGEHPKQQWPSKTRSLICRKPIGVISVMKARRW